MAPSTNAPANPSTPISPPSNPPPSAPAPAVFTSPQGFSITPPDGWVVASKDTIHQVGNTVQTMFPKLVNFDLSKLAVAILNPADSGQTNLNVVVSEGKTSIDGSGIEEKFAGMLRDQYNQMGISLDRISVTRQVFGTHTGLVADIEWSKAGLPSPIRAWQVVLPAGAHTLIVTCTGNQSSFDNFTPVFTKAIASMTYSNFAVPDWLQSALVGGIIGGLIGGLSLFLSPSRKKK